MCRCKTYLSGAEAKLLITSFRWTVNPSLLIFFFTQSRSINMRRYGLTNFLGDAFMTIITGGLWLIWVFVREVRGR